MNVLDHLTQEHRKAEQLMSQLAESESGPQRAKLVAELTDALQTHMAVEERFIYPIVATRIGAEPETEAETEHGLTRDGLDTLEELIDQPGFGAALEMLKAGVGHHVEEEETEVFPKLREKASDEIDPLDPEQLEAEVRESGDTIDLTRDELYHEAQEADIPGRSSMSKDELAKALHSNSGGQG